MAEKKTSSLLKDNLVEILALMWTTGGITFLFCAAAGVFKGTESVQTQIIQGVFGILILITGYYWGSSSARKSAATTIQTQDNAQVTVGPNMGETPDVTVNGDPPTKPPCPEC